MKLSTRILASLVAAAPLLLAAAGARAEEPCGKFDFSAGIDCRIEVSGGCQAHCTPFKFEAGCKGGCTATAQTSCVDSCGAACVAECDPAALDCFAGCHGECDAPTQAECESQQPGADCVNTAKAQCDMHCEDACMVPQNDCTEHCHACCTGSCTTQVNFGCDFDCFAKLEGSCNVQCTEPTGAIFCNGQYVGASDVQACITYLATQGIEVDVSARGSATCDLSGCKSDGSVSGLPSAGCSAASHPDADAAASGLAILALGAAVAATRRRRRK